MSKTKIGLLVFYLELYNDVFDAELSASIKSFIDVIKGEYENRGFEVIAKPECCVTADFEKTIADFENENVDALVSLHLAYSPSLESSQSIAKTKLPIVILDTTPDFEYGFDYQKERLLYNHGIHGVQDFCNLMIRNGKDFTIEAGHWQKSDVIDRTVAAVKGLKAAKKMQTSKVGIIGKPFKGMGDFAIPFETLKEKIGMDVVSVTSEDVAKFCPKINSDEVASAVENDFAAFDCDEVKKEDVAVSEVAAIGLQNWVKQENLDAFSMNFLDINGAPGLEVVPFLGTSKLMADGIGYAGEGDVLTAAFCGALSSVIPKTTFTEMFCPDWEGNRIFMSHMGEININLTDTKPNLFKYPFIFGNAGDPIIAYGCLQAGEGWIINLAPGANDTFTLIASPVEVCDAKGKYKVKNSMKGWIKPKNTVGEFLQKYSQLGGTHHKVLCYGGDDIEGVLASFAKNMGWKFARI